MRGWRIAAIGTACVAIAFLGLRLASGPEGAGPRHWSAANGAVDAGDAPSSDDVSTAPSPFAAVDGAVIDGATGNAAGAGPGTATGGTGTSPGDPSVAAGTSGADPSSGVRPLDGPVDLQRLGRGEALSEEALAALVARLSADPDLLAALIDEFRAERDPARLRRLSNVLDQLGDEPAIADLAEELVYSGDEIAGEAGLWLLAQLPPGSGRARSVASGLMSGETNGRVLVGALNALGSPASADADTRAGLAEQVSLLVGHEDPAVRRGSINQLSRWSRDAAHTPLIVDGLSDSDPGVRETSAYALVGHAAPDEAMRRELFAIIENEAEAEGPRRAAVLALNRMPLDQGEQARVRAVQRSLAYR